VGAAIFIGDELGATGFRLAGVEALVPQGGEALRAFQDARARAALVILTAEVAHALPRAELDAAQRAEAPAVAIVPDVLLRSAGPDLAAIVRSALGIDTGVQEQA
jgi:vacuolar-type H+-ATPase subunit F/Vma7